MNNINIAPEWRSTNLSYFASQAEQMCHDSCPVMSLLLQWRLVNFTPPGPNTDTHCGSGSYIYPRVWWWLPCLTWHHSTPCIFHRGGILYPRFVMTSVLMVMETELKFLQDIPRPCYVPRSWQSKYCWPRWGVTLKVCLLHSDIFVHIRKDCHPGSTHVRHSSTWRSLTLEVWVLSSDLPPPRTHQSCTISLWVLWYWLHYLESVVRQWHMPLVGTHFILALFIVISVTIELNHKASTQH